MSARRTVLVLTGKDDPTADVVIGEIVRRGAPVARFDVGDFPVDAQLTAIHTDDGYYGRLSGPDGTVDLEEIGSVYYRRPSRFTFPPGMSDADRVYAETEARLGLGGVLAGLAARWVNHPHHIARAEWKGLQLEIARRVGLRTPPTLIGNEAAQVTEFARLIEEPIVCKTFSSLVLAENGQHKITYTTAVDPTAIDPQAFAATAHLVQAWVPKARECRATVVGEQVLAVAIETDSPRARVDWRADYDALHYLPIEVPADTTAKMVAYLRELNLHYGVFDFAITPDDEWVMFECNPSGQWLWLHHAADLPIPAALADLLTGDPS